MATAEEKKARMKERTRKYYAMRREQHLCVACGWPDENTLAGRARCRKCTERIRPYQNEYLQNIRAQRKAQNLCHDCGKQDADTLAGLSTCKACRLRRSSWYAARKEKNQ